MSNEYNSLTKDVYVCEPLKRGSAFTRVFTVFLSFFKGMRITFSYLISPKTVITQQYPENRETLKMFDRYRHNLKLKYNDQGEHNCTGCKICEVHCPNVSIIIESNKGEISGKVEVDSYIWRLDSCTFCNICVLVCPFDALEWSSEFESTVYDRRLLVYQLNEYAGPTAKAIGKFDEEKAAKWKEARPSKARSPFDAKVPMNGETMAGVAKLSDPMSKKGGGESDV